MPLNNDEFYTIKIKRPVMSDSDGFFMGDEINLTIHWDAKIEEWVNAFRLILAWSSFVDGSINLFIKDPYEDDTYLEERKDTNLEKDEEVKNEP